MKLENLKEKKILILGFGREGKNTYKTLKKLFPEKKIFIFDENKKEADEKELKNISKYEVIIKTPGIPFSKIKQYLSKKNIVTSQTELFLENCKGKVIGVTGTKGKSTTSSLIYKILKDNGFKVKLVGNIGKPALSYVLTSNPKDIFVYELSCHQLDNIKISPNIAVFLNIYPEHLDYYKNFRSYLNAKKNITRYQEKNDFLVLNSNLDIKTKAYKIFLKDKKSINNIHPEIISAVIAVSKIFGLPEKEIKTSISNFKKLDSRLEYVGKYNNIDFYNDSLATIPEATIFALNRLKNVDTLILGGLDRGIKYDKLIERIKEDNKIKNLILFPNSDKKIYKKLKDKKINFFFTTKMKEAVEIAKENTKKICLLSPAAPSFNLFKDYKDRGDQFKKYIKNEK